MFCFKGILQMWIILIGLPNTNDFVNVGIYKCESSYIKNTKMNHGHREVFNLH